MNDIEEIDKDILRILCQDSRKTNNAIATELEKSPVTIKKHVEGLEENNIIKQYSVQIDYDKLGYNIIAVIELTISKGKMLEVESQIAKHPNVFAVYDITGTYDALVLARFKDRSELSAMIKEIYKSPEVERTNTHIILNVIKEQINSLDLI